MNKIRDKIQLATSVVVVVAAANQSWSPVR